MSFHPEVMTEPQRRVLESIAGFTSRAGFYLGGGTAVALHVGHRRSVDLDWFTAQAVPDPMRLAAEVQRSIEGFAVTDVARGTLHGTANGVRLSFLEYPYVSLAPPLEWPDYRCLVAAQEDLACMKLSAVAGRGARKDFVDVYALGRRGFSLREMLDGYWRKFEVRDHGHVLMSLTYFDDAEEEEAPKMLWEVGWGEVKRTIEGWVREYVEGESSAGPGG